MLTAFILAPIKLNASLCDSETYACAYCEYKVDDTTTLKYFIASDGTTMPSPKIIDSFNSGAALLNIATDLTHNDFLTKSITGHDTFECPNQIYVYTQGEKNYIYKDENSQKSSVGIKKSLINLKTGASNGEFVFKSDAKTYTCSYDVQNQEGLVIDKASVISDGTNIVGVSFSKEGLNIPSSTYNSYGTIARDFSDGNCPELKVVCEHQGGTKYSCELYTTYDFSQYKNDSNSSSNSNNDSSNSGSKSETSSLPVIEDVNYCSKLEGVWVIGGYVMFMIKILVPLLLIIMSMVELTKAIAADKDTNPFSLIKNKIIAAVAVFLVAQLVTIVISAIGSDTDWQACAKCAAHPFSSGCSLLQVKQEHDGVQYYTSVEYVTEKYNDFYQNNLNDKEKELFIRSLGTVLKDDDKLQEVLSATNSNIHYLEKVYYQTKCYTGQTVELNGTSWECVDSSGSRRFVATTKGKSNSSSENVDYVLKYYDEFINDELSDDQLIEYVRNLGEAHDRLEFAEIRRRAEGSFAIIYTDKLEEAYAEAYCKVALIQKGKNNGFKNISAVKDSSNGQLHWDCVDENGKKWGNIVAKYQNE